VNKEDEQRRAAEAQFLIDHPLFSGAFDAVREALINQIELGRVQDERTQRDLFIALKQLSKVRRLIEEHVKTGEMAEQTHYPEEV
jgi:hypothetical protein